VTDDDISWPKDMYGDQHNMGTTRMHRDPRLGVVDEDCRLHGVANLYVAGSSTFPAGGAANPTLTIVALALRLADHLKERLA
jgi:choline dehydrogenase-like flavoprotein